MNNRRTLAILSSVLILAFMTSLALLGRALWRNYWWKEEVYGLASMLATKEAMEDFSKGKLRLLVIAGENDQLRYSGTNDGPFEVWIPQFYPSLGYPHRYQRQQRAEFYNRKMRYMHEHPEKFLAKTNTNIGQGKKP